ncbi:NUDIX hydrolase [Candidatus Poribacteria bacterium]|nr:NUDIX hydrolase [Candidatus Poribacteria bacterium]MYG07477.1 NUDIX hydrolase [Candidatus Poribacteria bacterium]MYK23548.1 NUDIX hydrolase [Candidatus Poribacteria bacterium]
MQSNINPPLIQQLLSDAEKDGVQKLVVGAVIYRNNKFLLLERVLSDSMGGFVGIPSGTVEAGEDLLTALAREVQEETGLTVTSVLEYLRSFDWTSSSVKKTRHFNFFVEVKEGEIKLSPTEHQAYYWVALSDAAFTTLNISDATKAILRAAAQR